MIKTINEIYEYVDMMAKKCRDYGFKDIAQQLDNAMYLGSSGLEILGAIKNIIIMNTIKLNEIADREKMEEIVAYVNSAYGILPKTGAQTGAPQTGATQTGAPQTGATQIVEQGQPTDTTKKNGKSVTERDGGNKGSDEK